MLTAGSASFEYDDNGNLVTKTVGSNVTNYIWDFNNMLTHLTNPGNSYEYRYDGLWNRRARIENSVEKRYVFGLAETDASGNITAYYVYGLGLISKITPSNQSYFYHFDGIASTIGISDLSGNMVNKYAYDAFGKVLNQEEGIANPFKYVGQFGVMDEGNGLFYMSARYYDPEAGRFMSKDPIRFLGGLNLYTYVANNPLNRIDPLGLWCVDINVFVGEILGVTFGVMIGPEGIHPYLGGGWGYPSGFAITFSPSDPVPGWNEGIQVGIPIPGTKVSVGGQFGYSHNNCQYYWEVGYVSPGISITDFYVWGPYRFNPTFELSDIPNI
jgi:RHS repeat-associated protein